MLDKLVEQFILRHVEHYQVGIFDFVAVTGEKRLYRIRIRIILFHCLVQLIIVLALSFFIISKKAVNTYS